jgi:hypothetical protein
MNRDTQGSSIRIHRRAVALATLLGALAASSSLQAQIIAIGPPSFQSDNYPSLEADVLARTAVDGQYQPQDLAVLSRLTVLESIAMFAEIQADMPGSYLADQLEVQIRVLWEVAQEFYESVSLDQLDAGGLTHAKLLFSEVDTAAGQLEWTFGRYAGLSSRAATRLGDIARLTAATRTAVQAVEGQFLASAPILEAPSLATGPLATHARLLANDLVPLIASAQRVAARQGVAWDSVTRDLRELFNFVQRFQQTLAQSSTNREIMESFEPVRRLSWRVNSEKIRLAWPDELDRAWRGIRVRMNVISDGLGMPRVIDRAPPIPSSRPGVPESLDRPAPRIYRGPPQ